MYDGYDLYKMLDNGRNIIIKRKNKRRWRKKKKKKKEHLCTYVLV